MLYDPYKSFRCKDVSRDTIFIRDLYDNFLQEVEVKGEIVQRFSKDYADEL